MGFYPNTLDVLIEKFASLPGIGKKSAQRLAFYVLTMNYEEAENFANAIMQAKRNIRRCKICQNLSEDDICPICASDTRDKEIICVVSEPKDVFSIEKSHEYKGVYHVLHGVLSPANRIGPGDIKIQELIDRVNNGSVKEIIMATNPDTEGETTALYISRLLKPYGMKITRLAYGVPVGSNLEFTDEATLTRALEGRIEI
jgi:recombination protein RecR